MRQLVILFVALLGVFLGVWTYKINTPVNRPDEYADGVSVDAGNWWNSTTVQADESWELDPEIPLNYIPVPGEDELYMVIDNDGKIIGYRKRTKQIDGSWLWEDVNPDIPENYEAVEGLDDVYKVTYEDGTVKYYQYIRNDDDTFAFVEVDENGNPVDRDRDATVIDGKHVHISDNTYALLNDYGVVIGYDKRVENEDGTYSWIDTTMPDLSDFSIVEADSLLSDSDGSDGLNSDISLDSVSDSSAFDISLDTGGNSSAFDASIDTSGNGGAFDVSLDTSGNPGAFDQSLDTSAYSNAAGIDGSYSGTDGLYDYSLYYGDLDYGDLYYDYDGVDYGDIDYGSIYDGTLDFSGLSDGASLDLDVDYDAFNQSLDTSGYGADAVSGYDGSGYDVSMYTADDIDMQSMYDAIGAYDSGTGTIDLSSIGSDLTNDSSGVQVINNGDGTHTEVETVTETKVIDGWTYTYETYVKKTYDAAGNLISTISEGPYETASYQNLTTETEPVQSISNKEPTLSGELARVTGNYTYNSSLEAEVYALLNAQRASNGLNSLTRTDTANAIAQLRAADMAGYDTSDESLPTYGTLSNMLADYSISSSVAGENLWKSIEHTADDIHTRFQALDSTRETRMNASATQYGIAIVEKGGYYYICEVVL